MTATTQELAEKLSAALLNRPYFGDSDLLKLLDGSEAHQIVATLHKQTELEAELAKWKSAWRNAELDNGINKAKVDELRGVLRASEDDLALARDVIENIKAAAVPEQIAEIEAVHNKDVVEAFARGDVLGLAEKHRAILLGALGAKEAECQELEKIRTKLYNSANNLGETCGELRCERDAALADVAALNATIDRLQSERNAIIAASELGQVSEHLEADNQATDAQVVRRAMLELERLRVEKEKLQALAYDLEEELSTVKVERNTELDRKERLADGVKRYRAAASQMRTSLYVNGITVLSICQESVKEWEQAEGHLAKDEK